VAGEPGRLLGHPVGLAEHDARLVAGGRGDVHLGLGLPVGDQEVEAVGAGLDGLAVLAGQPEADLGAHPETGDGVDPSASHQSSRCQSSSRRGDRAQRPLVWRT